VFFSVERGEGENADAERINAPSEIFTYFWKAKPKLRKFFIRSNSSASEC